ncbi:MAG: type II secretion system protein [bacterium]|nr:type II secretion system protein [bacterium]
MDLIPINNKKWQSGGFTIIELLVVTAIIALLASAIFVTLSSARAKGRDATREQHIKTLQSALESFYTNARRYPICDPGEFVTGSDCLSVDLVNAEAIAASPLDPLNQGNNRYFYESVDGVDYVITYYLETDGIPAKSAGENQATP